MPKMQELKRQEKFHKECSIWTWPLQINQSLTRISLTTVCVGKTMKE